MRIYHGGLLYDNITVLIMKKYYSVYLLLPLLFCLSFLSCSEDKDDMVEKTEFFLSASELNILTGDKDTIFIDGDGVYTAVSANESIAFVEIVDKEVVVTSDETGSTVITISDTREDIIAVPKQIVVQVKEYSEKFLLTDEFLDIQLEDETYRKEIEDDCKKNTIMSLGNILEFTFLSAINGRFHVYQKQNEAPVFDGAFLWNWGYFVKTRIPEPQPINVLVIKSDNSEYVFSVQGLMVICFSVMREATKSITLEPRYTLIENLTEKYQQKYPQAGISSVSSHQVIYKESLLIN